MPIFKSVQRALLALCLVAMSLAHAAPPPEEQKLIATLIQRVEAMNGMKFVRNGSEYSSVEAAKHMRAKYDHFKDKIGTADEFITRCASRSEMTGAAYKIKTADGKEHDANAFLTQELRKVRSGAASG
ncbi:MAG: hypothetical protein EOP78_04235 [Variovorax sp.]|nr:MAG: hypothetical protein EOP78_04235 [Variovorax sp.]